MLHILIYHSLVYIVVLTFAIFCVSPIEIIWHVSFGAVRYTRARIFIVAAKNSEESHQNNIGSKAQTDNTLIKYSLINLVGNVGVLTHYISAKPLEVLNTRMWPKTKTVGVLGVLFNNASVRGFKTWAASNAARSSPAQPGYASEDKIVQIKPHQNDYAQQYPSVTLILNKTMTEESRTALEKWKQERISEMGLEEFNKFYQGTFFICQFLLLVTFWGYFFNKCSEFEMEWN